MKYFGILLQFTLLLYAGINNLYAQKAPKFGKIDLDNLHMNSCPIDSNAHAYYVFDYGDAAISNNKLFYQRHFCIKIIDSEGFSNGIISIPLFHAGGEEKVTKLKAVTYNLENGQLVESELNSKDKYLEKTSEYMNTLRFALPNIKAGSLIEVEYIIRSDYFSIPTWFFQHKIPTIYSDYIVTIPEFFYYAKSVSGYYPVKSEKTEKNDHINSYTFRSNVFHYSADSIPSFPQEQFLRTMDNYVTKISFELESIKFPMRQTIHYTSSWEKIDNDLLDDEYFGDELKSSGYIKDIAETIQKSNPADKFQLMNMAFQHIKKQISWNGFSTKYINTTLKEAYKKKSGNCADINLNLVRLLRELGFQSFPVILSTQKNGIINPSHPSQTAFNYVIAMAILDGTTYLMDATDPTAEINLLPIRCLNDKGRVIGDTPNKWINLMNYKSYVQITNYVVTLDSNSNFNVQAGINYKDYGAYVCQKEIKDFNNLSDYTKSLEDNSSHTNIDDFKILKVDSLSNKLNISYHLTIENQEDIHGDLFYFSPVIHPYFKENPFKSESREYPVEFNYPYRIMQVQNYKLPPDYEIIEMPKPAKIIMPDNSAQFVYQIKKMNTNLIVSSIITINKSIFLPDEYAQLRQFFQLFIGKQQELIVLKKNESHAHNE